MKYSINLFIKILIIIILLFIFIFIDSNTIYILKYIFIHYF